MPTGTLQRSRVLCFAAVAVAVLYSSLRAQGTQRVPAIPPDTEPVGLYDDTNVVVNDSYLGGIAVKNTILVLFTATATQTQRQAAVNSVHGVVVGGNRFLPNLDGNYLIRIANDSSGSRLAKAIAKLQSLPQVDFAGTLDLSNSVQSWQAIIRR